MPTPTKGPRLGGSPKHEQMILNQLCAQLFEHGRITTTETKAKRMRPVAEKLISKAKRGDLHARRLVLAQIADKSVVHTLFTEIAPAVAGRDGGYTRIVKVGNRKGDNAPMAVIELVTESVEESRANKDKAAKKAATPAKPAAKPAAAAAAAKPETAHADAPAEGAAEDAAPVEPVAVPAEAPAEGATDVVADETPAGATAAEDDAK